MPRGGRRRGAGAPRGNVNALKYGRYSPRIEALRSAIDVAPDHVGTVRDITGGNRDEVRKLAEALAFYADILRASANGETFEDAIGHTNPELLRRILASRERAYRRKKEQ
jgi:hypothetical protein